MWDKGIMGLEAATESNVEKQKDEMAKQFSRYSRCKVISYCLCYGYPLSQPLCLTLCFCASPSHSSSATFGIEHLLFSLTRTLTITVLVVMMRSTKLETSRSAIMLILRFALCLSSSSSLIFRRLS